MQWHQLRISMSKHSRPTLSYRERGWGTTCTHAAFNDIGHSYLALLSKQIERHTPTQFKNVAVSLAVVKAINRAVHMTLLSVFSPLPTWRHITLCVAVSKFQSACTLCCLSCRNIMILIDQCFADLFYNSATAG